MSWTKRQFIVQAYEEIGLASYVFDLEPEQIEGAMRTLDAMMATWNGVGIRIGYPIPTSPENSDLDQETGVPDRANEAIYTNLAMRLAPKHGKTVPAETRSAARMGYDVLLRHAALPPEMQFPDTLPQGAGSKHWRVEDDPFVLPPKDPINTGPDGNLDFN